MRAIFYPFVLIDFNNEYFVAKVNQLCNQLNINNKLFHFLQTHLREKQKKDSYNLYVGLSVHVYE